MKALPNLIEAGAAYNAGRFNRKVADYNARNTLAEGEADALDLRDQGREAEGQQLTALAGSGFDVGSGSAFDLLRQTEVESTLDILKRRRKAGVDALGFKIQGAAAYAAGKNAAAANAIEAVNKTVDYAASMGG